MTISLPVATMLEMAARNNGFDRELPPVEGWLGFSSTKAPLKVWLAVRQEVDYVAALSQHNVVHALADGAITTGPLPSGAVGARVVPGLPALHRLLRRAFQLSRSLPHELLHSFEKKTARMPRTREAERLDVFNGLLLAPQLDAAFDRGFITVADDGVIIVSAALAEGDRRAIGVEAQLTVKGLGEGHRQYLVWHRDRVFKTGVA